MAAFLDVYIFLCHLPSTVCVSCIDNHVHVMYHTSNLFLEYTFHQDAFVHFFYLLHVFYCYCCCYLYKTLNVQLFNYHSLTHLRSVVLSSLFDLLSLLSMEFMIQNSTILIRNVGL